MLRPYSPLLVVGVVMVTNGCQRHVAQPEPAALYLPYPESKIASHILSFPPPLRLSKNEWDQLIHLTGQPCGGQDYLPYRVRVSADGTVEDATLTPYECWQDDKKAPPDPPAFIKAHLDEAQLLLRQGHFRPWVVNGRVVPVLIDTDLSIAPPEKYGAPLPFPQHLDMSTVVITMQVHGCEGRCPVYTVTILGDGTVQYEGFAFVSVIGKRTAHIDPRLVSSLIDQFDRARFFSALPKYIGGFDGGDITLQISANHVSHSVEDSMGMSAGLPTAVGALETQIHQVANTCQWIYGE